VEAAMKNDSLKRMAAAVIDTLRGIAAALRRERCCPPIHYAGLR